MVFSFFYFYYMGGEWKYMIRIMIGILNVIYFEFRSLIYEVFIICLVEVFFINSVRFLVLVLIYFEYFLVLFFLILFN